MPKRYANNLLTASLYIFYGLIAYMPLHIFLSTIIGVQLHVLDLAKVLKDIVLLAGFVPLFLISIKKPWFKAWIKEKLVLFFIAYAVLTLILVIFRPNSRQAEILGVVDDLRFLLFFLYGWLLTYHFSIKTLKKRSIQIVLAVGVLVVSFGIVQYLFLPNNALTHLGFTRSNGVLPAFFIDDKPNLERVMSTIRDPNSLGAYLLILIGLCMAKFFVVKKRLRVWYLLYGLAIILCLYFTFSRSAWIGAILTTGVFVLLAGKDKIRMPYERLRLATMVVVALLLVATSALFVGRNTYFVKNTIFHADASTKQADPNQLRVGFWRDSVNDTFKNPLGTGAGSVGVVSSKNKAAPGRLTENYYLQVAGEQGLLGLILFLIICVLIAVRLFERSKLQKDLFAVAIFASFIGISFSGLLNHIWINEAVAYTWWGLAGLYMLASSHNNDYKSNIKQV